MVVKIVFLTNNPNSEHNLKLAEKQPKIETDRKHFLQRLVKLTTSEIARVYPITESWTIGEL